MRVLLLAVAVLLCCSCYGQGNVVGYYGPYLFPKGTAHVVFSDTAFVRDGASVNAGVKDTLFLFDVVRITDTAGGMLTIGRKEAPWYSVRYTKSGVV